MSVVKYSGEDSNDLEKNCKCGWLSTCSYCKDQPRRSRQAEKDRLKAYKHAQNSQNYQKTLDKMAEMDLSGFSTADIKYKNSKKGVK